MSFLRQLGIELPILQAPMAGVSTPALAAAVSNAGALGGCSVGAADAAGARTMLDELRSRTTRPFNVNVFANRAPVADAQRDRAWLDALAPTFHALDAEPPASLRLLYRGLNEDNEIFATLLDAAPRVVSFHFGLPLPDRAAALRSRGASLIVSVTSVAEGRLAERAGMDAVIAQGWEAGGHRGTFDPSAPDERLGTFALTRLLARRLEIPVIAAGGIMDGAGIAAALALGAAAAQLGTAFVACPESSATPAHREALLAGDGAQTVMTHGISGRAARGLQNRLIALVEQLSRTVAPPDYPIAYDAAKSLVAAAAARGESGFGVHLAGQGARLARAMPASELVATLAREIETAQKRTTELA
jgi:nitronate monooxygenase